MTRAPCNATATPSRATSSDVSCAGAKSAMPSPIRSASRSAGTATRSPPGCASTSASSALAAEHDEVAGAVERSHHVVVGAALGDEFVDGTLRAGGEPPVIVDDDAAAGRQPLVEKT